MKRVIYFVFALFAFMYGFCAAEITGTALQQTDAYLQKAAKNGYSGSVLIAQNGKIVFQKGYGMADREKSVPFTTATIFDIGSVTKQFSAAAILKLEMEKKLSVQDLMSKYLKGVPEDKKGITLHHLLTHTAGLVGGLGADEDYIDREAYLKLAFDSKLENPPGSTYDYSNVGFSLLAAVVEVVSGKEYEEFVMEKLFAPAGMKETGYRLPKWDKSKMAIGYNNKERWGTTYDQSNYSEGVTWHLKGNGGIHSTVGDMFRWYMALQGNSILNDEEKKKFFYPHVPQNDDRNHYGYGWGVQKNDRGEQVITHNGGNGYFMDTVAMFPDQKAFVVVATNNAAKSTDVIATRMDRLLFEELKPLEESFLRSYSGTYALPSGTTFQVSFNENDEAVTLLNDKETFLLFSGGESEDQKQSSAYDQKTLNLFNLIRAGDFKAAVATGALSSPLEEAQKNFTEWRQGIEKNNGAWKSTEVLGSVSRRQGNFYLTPIRMICEKGNVYQMIVWNRDDLFDVRDLPEGNTKPFEHVSGSEFYSEGNDLRIFFEGTSLILKGKTRSDIRAVRK